MPTSNPDRHDHASALGSQVKAAMGTVPAAKFGAAGPADFGADFNGASSIGTFFIAVANYIGSFVKQGIDTPEERQRVKEAVLAAFDAYLAPSLGPLLKVAIRRSLDNFVTNMLETFGS